MGSYEEERLVVLQLKLEGTMKNGFDPRVVDSFIFTINLKGDGENEQTIKSIKAVIESKRIDDSYMYWRRWSSRNFGHGSKSNT